MDAYEATKIVYQRIQTLDPENASKIMGLLLIQDHGEKEMIRLAFGPENSIHSVILKAKKELGLSSPNTPLSLTRQSSFSSASSKLLISTPNSYNSSLSSPMNSKATPFYANGGEIDLIDELQLQDQLTFLNDDVAGNWGGGDGGSAEFPHRRSCSVSDICLYYARGYCKNGNTCRFIHGDGGGALAAAADGGGMVMGSPNKFEMFEQELLRSKSTHQQRMAIATQLMASSNFAYSPVNSPREMMMGDGMNKFSRNFGINCMSPGSRQIYLTFPADSTFKEEDVSNYFSIFGPVQDVRIPYQQKRMFGFVTFEYSDTVKLILAKGNPHFVCDARVLVKPYKEKGKIPERHRRQHQQIDRGEYPGCGSPTGLESRDPHDFQLGARMFYNTQDMLWRRKLEEEADLQHAIELQNRRLMSLQLLDAKRNNHHRAFSAGTAISSPTYSPSFFNQNVVLSGDRSSPELKEENGSIGVFANPANVASDFELIEKEKVSCVKDDNSKIPQKESDFQESSEHNLPDSPFASPKAAGNYMTTFSTKTMSEVEKGTNVVTQTCDVNTNFVTSPSLYPTSSLDMAPFKSCHFHVPRFSSGHETIGI